MVFPEQKFTEAGKITHWTFHATHAGTVGLQVYKPVSCSGTSGDQNWILVGANEYTVGSAGVHEKRVAAGEQISVEPDYVLGIRQHSPAIVPYTDGPIVRIANPAAAAQIGEQYGFPGSSNRLYAMEAKTGCGTAGA